MPLAAGQTFAGYTIVRLLGAGGMGEVYLAEHPRLPRRDALKVLISEVCSDGEYRQRFNREADIAATLWHPHIIGVHDRGDVDGQIWISMDYVDGTDAGELVRDRYPKGMPKEEVLDIVTSVGEALDYAHQQGLLHRDVKPANIMISKGGAVKVMDFGIARAIADSGNPVTQTSAVIGTAQYLSPEQARGETVDARSDVYSLGCVLYEILTGEPPFVGDSPVAVAYQHVREDPVPPSQRHPGIAPELDAVVLKALAKNPDNRYQTAAEMRADLIRVHSGETPDAPKVFTDAERTSLLSAAAPSDRTSPTEQMSVHQPPYGERERGPSVGRWLIAVAVLAVLTVVVTIAINMIGGNTRDVQVPDVRGQVSADAVVALQNAGFKTRTQQRPDSTVEVDHVIDTEPEANAEVGAGDEITINVSTGPEQREIPDVASLPYAEAVKKLTDAGFGRFKQSPSPSTPELKDRVVGTLPPANQTSAITNEVTIVIGSGPEAKSVPDVENQAEDSARQILTASGFTNLIAVPVDNTAPCGQIVGTDPPPGQQVPVDTAIQLQKSECNQFTMPDLRGQFWTDAEPRLRALGWTGGLDRGGDVRDSGQRTNAVVTQSPSAGSTVNFSATITLSFAA